MSAPVLHIISFDIPYPPSYGGVVDVFFRIKALSENGVRVVLHCFQYGREVSKELSRLCAEVHYYPRLKPSASLPIKKPHIVISRQHPDLLDRLLADEHPIWFEGLHCCFYLDHPLLKERTKYVRLHNIEWQYYQQLADRAPSLSKKLYFKREAAMLKKYEYVLWAADKLMTISAADQAYYHEKYITAEYLPAFHGYSEVKSPEGLGEYCLYHGKLSVPENHEAAMFLLEHVFAQINIPLIIAGAEPLPELIEATSNFTHINLRANPDEAAMHALMQGAQVHVLPTFQASGIKLKLLHALFAGRHVMVNEPMLAGTNLGELCHIAETPAEFQQLIQKLYYQPFSTKAIQQRKAKLSEFDTNALAERIRSFL
ncbi:MAG: glycosyltransferase [Bacteroidia bacterium]